MKTAQRQPVANGRRGTALVMVVVLTVLLAVIGVLFVMVARIDEMATGSVVSHQDLDNAVNSVVDLIGQRLADDVPVPGLRNTFTDQFGLSTNSDRWLAPVEPRLRNDNGTPGDYNDDIIRWEHVSDVTGQIGGLAFGAPARPLPAADADHLTPADADGDGVSDSYWVRLPSLNTSRGEPVFAAIRIVDNNAMLNLNTASYIPDTSDPTVYVWPDMEGRFLSSVDYSRFLRGADRLNPGLMQLARQGGILPIDPPGVFHHNAIMHIENPNADLNGDGLPDHILFDISDELEIRNRFMLRSPYEARFERKDVSNFTFDAGGGIYSYLSIPRDSSNFAAWVWRIDPNNFDDQSGAYDDGTISGNYQWRYDRRHVCTFYSFDRNLRMGAYPAQDAMTNPVTMIFPPDPVAVSTNFGVWDPKTGKYKYNNTETRVQILKLLYAYRAYFLARYPSRAYTQAARQACQFVANMIDYIDDTDPLSQGPFFKQVADADGDVFDYGSQTNDNPTFINREVIRQLIMEVSKHMYGRSKMIDIDVMGVYEFGIGLTDPRETVYGYERQPFISEVVRYDHIVAGVLYAIELCNPYDKPLNIENWRLKIGSGPTRVFTAALDPGGDVHVPAATGFPAARVLGRRVLVSNNMIVDPDPDASVPHYVLAGMTIPTNTTIEFQRPDPSTPGEYITVDTVPAAQASEINANPGPQTFSVSKRDDTKWRFTRATSYTKAAPAATLKRANNTGAIGSGSGFQMPVADNNKPIGTLLDFSRVLLVGNERDPNGTVMKPITEHMTAAAAERNIRMDVLFAPWPAAQVTPLDYVCFMGRPEGSLPGRININTAPMEVIRAAIRDHADSDTPLDNETLARSVARGRYNLGLPEPYRRITDLLGVGFDQFATDLGVNVGDPEMGADIEERDWILSQVANLFTVRSDVFTAYILVRLGHDGPQRRMIAIFDRTNVYRDASSGKPLAKPRIVALHPVPDPR
ncbi:MAG: hypothetical protein IH624_11880 [Phycisphaerae bacterium]|nr:hypothetical protein [Phycisphaerae bacterium]